MIKINNETLNMVLSKLFNEKVANASYETEELQGGTVGSVWLVKGIAYTSDKNEKNYELVLKIQEKWERDGDPNSWRREYDLYSSGLDTYFLDDLKWPECYYYEMNQEKTEVKLWLEYINGVSGVDLSGEMYERSAYGLGKFQGKLYAEKPEILEKITNLSGTDYVENFYLDYKSWDVVYDYIRSENCEIPKHLCEMLIDIDENSDALFAKISKLPKILCHRDFWIENIFSKDGKTFLIDWDTTGWGYFGEDIASLIADEADVEHMVEYYQRCVSAYSKGFSEFANVSNIKDNCIKEICLLMYGYRIIEWFLDAEDDSQKKLQIDTLQKIYEIMKL